MGRGEDYHSHCLIISIIQQYFVTNLQNIVSLLIRRLNLITKLIFKRSENYKEMWVAKIQRRNLLNLKELHPKKYTAELIIWTYYLCVCLYHVNKLFHIYDLPYIVYLNRSNIHSRHINCQNRPIWSHRKLYSIMLQKLYSFKCSFSPQQVSALQSFQINAEVWTTR